MFIRNLPLSPGGTASGGTFLAGNGTAGAPSYSFASDTDTGMYRVGAGQIGFSTDGTLRFTIDGSTSLTSTLPFYAPAGSNTGPAYSYSGDPNTGSYSVGADQWGVATAGVLRLTVDVAVSITSTLPFYGPAGSNSIPAYTFSADPDTGLYRVGANQAGIATAGVLRLTVDNATSITSTLPIYAPDGAVGNPAYAWTNDVDCGYYRIGANNLGFALNGAKVVDWGVSAVAITQAVVASATVPVGFAWTAGAHTATTASTEVVDFQISLNTIQFATGALTNQRFVRFLAPTAVTAVGASTITNCATVAINNAPVQSTNVTMTNAWALWVEAGAIRFGGNFLMDVAKQWSMDSFTTGPAFFLSGAGGDFIISSGPAGQVTLFKIYNNLASGNANANWIFSANTTRAAGDIGITMLNNGTTVFNILQGVTNDGDTNLKIYIRSSSASTLKAVTLATAVGGQRFLQVAE